MAVGVEFLPMPEHRLARHRVYEVRGQFSQRSQHEAVLQDIAARHPHRAFVDYQIIVEQQVYIERTCCPFLTSPDTPGQIM